MRHRYWSALAKEIDGFLQLAWTGRVRPVSYQQANRKVIAVIQRSRAIT